eukprot:1145817-Pelagomonas_calceolata.AAC.1
MQCALEPRLTFFCADCKSQATRPAGTAKAKASVACQGKAKPSRMPRAPQAERACAEVEVRQWEMMYVCGLTDTKSYGAKSPAGRESLCGSGGAA